VEEPEVCLLIIFVIAAVITPTPDIPTQCLFAGPMLTLYVFSMPICYLFQKRNGLEEDEADEEEEDDMPTDNPPADDESEQRGEAESSDDERHGLAG